MELAHNLLLLTDSYKVTHWKQYPQGTEHVYSYLESRGGRFDEVVLFGLQYLLKRYLAGRVVTPGAIEEAEAFLRVHFGGEEHFHRAGWEHLLAVHRGRLPVEIRAVAEGTPVPVGNPLLVIENTDPACPWLTSYLETLLVQVWYGSTVATHSREMKRMLLEFLESTGDPGLVDFKLHDFGFRGVSSVESAGIGAAAHLVSFRGTDTLAGCTLLRRYYGEEMAGFSIPATEHSTITSWGEEGEVDAFRNLLDQHPVGPVACVSDSWNIFRACSELWGGALRDRVLKRDGTLVVRPDSGEPPETVLRVLEILGSAFGSARNAKGFRLLPPQVRVIQGDGIRYDSARQILETITRAGWSADNLTFGMGGGLLQQVDRDTLEFAMKCSALRVDGVWRDVWKQPVTDPRKHSKRGRLALERGPEGLRTVREEEAREDLLRPVFRNGELLVDDDLETIRARAAL